MKTLNKSEKIIIGLCERAHRFYARMDEYERIINARLTFVFILAFGVQLVGIVLKLAPIFDKIISYMEQKRKKDSKKSPL